MSAFVKTIIMAVAWLVFTLLTFYTCVQPKCCSGELAGAAVGGVVDNGDDIDIAPPPAADRDFAIYSTLGATGAGAAITGSLWPQVRTRLIGDYEANPDQRLEVYGRYYASEPTPDGYANMGLYRAEQIKNLIVEETDIPADKIQTLARLLPSTDRPAGDERFDVGQFDWQPLDAGSTDSGGDAVQIVELDQRNIIIRFPLDQSTKNLDESTEDYLQKLAQRIQQTNERVRIVGHADSQGGDAYNQRLGQRRADFVKERLVRYGAPAGSITTASQGESSPTATNATAEGRRLNRRAELTLVQ